MSGDLLGFFAAAIVVATGVVWFQLIKAVRIPQTRAPYFAAMALGVVLGIAAFAQGTGILGGVAAGFSIVAGGFFVVLRLQSAQARNQPAVRLGDSILDFTAPDDQGKPFELASLRGRPFLLKFFRGHWWPYCVAELRRWEELRPELDARGIQIVTVSGEASEEIRKGRSKHGAQAVMLADPELEVTTRYNLRNERNLSPKGISALPIPTTFLIDAQGLVRWIDQAEDYQVRSRPERVLAAIEQLP